MLFNLSILIVMFLLSPFRRSAGVRSAVELFQLGELGR